MAIAGRWMARSLQPARFREPDSIFNVYALCWRRLHDGGHLGRGCFAGRPPATLEPVLDLRQQPHHHRGPHRFGLQRGCSHAFHRATAGTSLASATPTIWTCSARAFRTVPEHDRPADADHRRQPHRLRRPEKAGHAAPPTASRLGEEEIRLTKRNYGWPEDAKFFVPDGVYEHFQNGIGKRGKRRCATPGSTQLAEYQGQVSGTGRSTRTNAASRQLPEGWDKNLPVFPGRRARGSPARGLVRPKVLRTLIARRMSPG